MPTVTVKQPKKKADFKHPAGVDPRVAKARKAGVPLTAFTERGASDKGGASRGRHEAAALANETTALRERELRQAEIDEKIRLDSEEKAKPAALEHLKEKVVDGEKELINEEKTKPFTLDRVKENLAKTSPTGSVVGDVKDSVSKFLSSPKYSLIVGGLAAGGQLGQTGLQTLTEAETAKAAAKGVAEIAARSHRIRGIAKANGVTRAEAVQMAKVMDGASSSKLLKILTSKPVLIGVGGALTLGTTLGGISGMTVWLASDNIISGTDVFTRDLVDFVNFGQMTAEDALTLLEQQQHYKNLATERLNLETRRNPLLWAFKDTYTQNAQKAQTSLDLRRELLSNMNSDKGGA